MTNPFEAYADRARVAPVKLREARVERSIAKAMMKPTPLEKKMLEQAELLKHYRRFKKEFKDDLVKRYKKDVTQLVRMLRTLHMDQHGDVVLFVQGAQWLHKADLTDRLAVLSYIDHALCRSRVRAGYPPMDDPLPGQPDDAFRIIRKVLTGV